MMLFTFSEGLGFSLLSITIVILLIGTIMLAISPLKKLSPQIKKARYDESIQPTNSITTEDMMVAALVASIDYKEETGKEPFLKSIREIR
ncbi:MAG: hypothetical protein PF513_04095 [Tenericutes bacterium]|jgi:hypothetical protein|nr:hypothetical protein [Mycoplasmatota bacterium]